MNQIRVFLAEDSQMAIGLLIFIVSLMVLTLAVCLLVSFISSFRYSRIRKNNDNNVRIYIYNYGSEPRYFTCFDKTDVGKVKRFTEEEFLKQFLTSDSYRVKDWLRSIEEDRAKTDMIQADIEIKSKKIYVSSMLEYDADSYPIDQDKCLIHFTSYLLPYVFSNNIRKSLKKKTFRRTKIPAKATLSIADAPVFMNAYRNDYTGAIYCFKLFLKGKSDEELTAVEQNLLASVNHDIALRVSQFMTKYRKMVIASPIEEIVIDTKAVSRIMAMNMAETIYTSLQQILNMKTNQNPKNANIGVCVGVSLGSLYRVSGELDYHLAVSQCEKMADGIRESNSQEKVAFFTEAYFQEVINGEEMKTKLKNFIKNSTFRIYYTPAFDVLTNQVAFYMTDIVPYGTDDYDFMKCLEMSRRFKGGYSLLFANIDRSILNACRGRTEKTQFLIRIPYASIENVVKALDNRKNPNIEYILAVAEKEIMREDEGKQNASVRKIRKITDAGLKFALIIETSTKDLRDGVMNLASYFLISTSFTADAVDVSKSRNGLRTIQLNYVVYGKPLVYYGLTNAGDVELGAHYGGSIFECTAIAAPSSRLEGIKTRKREDILTDAKRLLPKNEDYYVSDDYNSMN